MERQKILLAVKVPQAVEQLRKALISSGYEVKLVDNGASALGVCREFRPHLILADLELPKLDGHHLLRELKSQSGTRNIPFILMSRHRSVEERVHSISLGVDDYITTPFEVQEVMLRVANVLNEIDRLGAVPTQKAKGFSGKVAEMNVVELLQTLGIAQKTCVVIVQNANEEGCLYVKEGQVFDATLANLDPYKALFRMFIWNEGVFHVEITDFERMQVVKDTTETLVRKGLLLRDRWNKLISNLPPLQTRVAATPKLSKEEYSPEERTILNAINGNTRLVDLIQKSPFDDFKALQLVGKLFYQGSLKAIPMEPTRLNGEVEHKNGAHQGEASGHLSKLVRNFLNAKLASDSDHSLNHGFARPVDLGEGAEVQQKRIYLNKSELLMIREKLSNGKHPGEAESSLRRSNSGSINDHADW